VGKTLHFLWIMDKRPERANSGTICDGLFDHLDGTLYAKAKTVFVCE